MCCRCGDHPARSAEEPFCPICVISIKVEVARADAARRLSERLGRLRRLRRPPGDRLSAQAHAASRAAGAAPRA